MINAARYQFLSQPTKNPYETQNIKPDNSTNRNLHDKTHSTFIGHAQNKF